MLNSNSRLPVSVSGSLEPVSGVEELLSLRPSNQPFTTNRAGRRIWGTPNNHNEKSYNFEKRETKFRQIRPKAIQELGIMRSPASAKVDFGNTSLTECFVFQSQTSTRPRPKKHLKRKPDNEHEQIHSPWANVLKELSKWGP